ncbi:zonular occludens toxin domain-containing protein [Pseudoalteromonas sp. S2755]|uniref:zonular occludens toxin domain-containing protein n=1 Tax=Pseudoalteromonas sp. S2755 TaxID=2066523 RepID=UPI00110A3B82|nr:zonular occludens toxin domain-containing protein [Pseudoalteromonas sp. S2755]TMN33717.1 hypothetical protein CWC03_18415 [Pseudoalteromonas sp. S2755]
MIHGISGRTGGGKSYEAVVRHIIPTVIKQKRKVVTNLPLDVDHFCSVYGDYCRDLIEVIDGEFHNYGGQRPFSRKEHYLQYEHWQNEQGNRVYFFIDECQLCLPQQGTDKELIQFYEMHRHYGFDIMLITQNFRKINRDIRDLVSNHYRAIKKSMLGRDDQYILKVHDGASASNSTVVATHEREYEQKYFKFYSSHTKSDKEIKEVAPSDVKKWWDNWFIKGAFLMFAFSIFILISAINSEPTKPKPESKENAQSPSDFQTPLVVAHGQSQNSLPNAQPANEQNTKRVAPVTEEPEPKTAEHPFHKVQLHINGMSEYTNRNHRIKTYYIGASQNGQPIFEMKLQDLYLAGYDVIVRSECMIEISYKGRYHDFITCDAPQIQMMPEQSMDTDAVAMQ